MYIFALVAYLGQVESSQQSNLQIRTGIWLEEVKLHLPEVPQTAREMASVETEPVAEDKTEK